MPLDRNVLIGSWELRSFDVDDGSGRRPWCPPATGLLLYGADQMMSVAINGSAPARDDALSAMLFYAGRYRLGFDGVDYVEHHVQQATDALRLGKTLRREIQLEGDALRLEGERPDGLRSFLVWQRIAA